MSIIKYQNHQYQNNKDAICDIHNIPHNALKKLYNTKGIEHEGIFEYDNRIYKISPSSKEARACNRLVGQHFENVVHIFSVVKTKVDPPNTFYNEWKSWDIYIIEQEKLYRNKHEFVYKYLSLEKWYSKDDVSTKLPYYHSVLNGVKELSSVGIYHQDLHSLNVMQTTSGTHKILDFGHVSLSKIQK